VNVSSETGYPGTTVDPGAAAAGVPLRMDARRDEGEQANIHEDGAGEHGAHGQQGGREREQRHATPDNAPHDTADAARCLTRGFILFGFGCGICGEEPREILWRVITQQVASTSIHGDPSGRTRRRQPTVAGENRNDPRSRCSEPTVAHEHKPGRFHDAEHLCVEGPGVVRGVPCIDATVAASRR
jgi:hypothetical protein